MIAWVAAAWAQDVSIEVDGSGAIVGHLVLSAPPDAVRRLISDPVALGVATGAVVTAAPDGVCQRVTTRVPHPIATVRYVTRCCPTPDGLRVTLVESEDLARYTGQWSLRAAGAGTELTYRLDVAPTFPLPGFIARAATRKGVLDLLHAIAATLSD